MPRQFSTKLSLLLLSLCLPGLVPRTFCQSPASRTTVDLTTLGYRTRPGIAISRGLGFAEDGTLWTAFPAEAESAARDRDDFTHSAHVVHFSTEGKVIADCAIRILSWDDVELFVRGQDGFVLRADRTFVSRDGECRELGSYNAPVRVDGVQLSPGRGALYLVLGDNSVQRLDARKLEPGKRMRLPGTARLYETWFGDESFAFATTRRRKDGCDALEITRVTLATLEESPWVKLDCGHFRLLDDHHLLFSGDEHHARLEMYRGSSRVATYKVPDRPYRSAINPSLVEATAWRESSGRVAELVDDVRGKVALPEFSGSGPEEHIDVIDMRKGVRICTVPVGPDSPLVSYALDHTGTRLGWMDGAKLEIDSLQ